MNDLELEQRALVPSGRYDGRLSHEVIFRFTFGHGGGCGPAAGGQRGQSSLVVVPQTRATGRRTVRYGHIVDGG